MSLGNWAGIYRWFHPAIDAIFAPGLPFTYRWRLLAFQPLALITYSISSARFIWSRPYTVESILTASGRTIRVLVYRPSTPTAKLRPLHLNCHSGGFIGGIPEAVSDFCLKVAEETGAVVISTSYRFAPRHIFPAAIDDVDGVVAYLQNHGRERFGLEPGMMTTSGFSAGGNLALATARSVPSGVMAAVTFYGAIDLRLKPEQKPKSAHMPKFDPASFLLPLFDAYGGTEREKNLENSRCHPAIAHIDDLPRNILMVVPEIDILVHEQLTCIKRLQEEASQDEKYAGRRYETLYDEKAFHGYLELPPSVMKEQRATAFGAGVAFIKDAHRNAGWKWP